MEKRKSDEPPKSPPVLVTPEQRAYEEATAKKIIFVSMPVSVFESAPNGLGREVNWGMIKTKGEV